MTFQITALPAEPFVPLFNLTDEQLAEHRAIRMTVTECPGSPCRVSLADADVGETVILINHTHLASNGPYHGSHAIYVREDAQMATPELGSVPRAMERRTLSLRALDKNQMFVSVELVDGTQLHKALNRLFTNPEIEAVHIHYASAGCFAAIAKPA